MFDFDIPAEAIRDHRVLEDPDKGMPADGLTHEQASVIIMQEHWKAAIAADWDTVRRLAPLDRSWKTGFRRNPPVELIEVRQPYPKRGYTGLVVPCVVRYEDGRIFESRAVVNYRQINGRPSCIIAAWSGRRALVERE